MMFHEVSSCCFITTIRGFAVWAGQPLLCFPLPDQGFPATHQSRVPAVRPGYPRAGFAFQHPLAVALHQIRITQHAHQALQPGEHAAPDRPPSGDFLNGHGNQFRDRSDFRLNKGQAHQLLMDIFKRRQRFMGDFRFSRIAAFPGEARGLCHLFKQNAP